MNLADFRLEYPQYDNMTDGQLADALHKKFYSNMPRAEFNEKVGLNDEPDKFVGPEKPSAGPQPISLPGLGRPSLIEMAKGIGRAVSLPGQVYRGEVDPLSNQGIARTAELAGIATPVAPAFRAVRPAQRGAQPELPSVSPKEVIAAGAAKIKEAESSPIAIDPRMVFNLVTATRNKLTGGHGPRLAEGVHAEVAALQKSAQDAMRAGAPLTAPDMVSYRAALTELSKGAPSATTSAAGKAKGIFDDWLNTNAPTLAATMDEAMANFRAGHLAAEVASPAARANIGAQTTASGMNIENRIRSSLGQIVAKERERELHGWRQKYSPEARAAIEAAAIPTGGETVQRMAGNLMGGGGGIAAGAYGITGALSNPLIAALPAAGWGIKTIANKKALEKADRAVQQVLKDSPYMRSREARERAAWLNQPIGGLLGLLARNPQLTYPWAPQLPLQLTVRPSDR